MFGLHRKLCCMFLSWGGLTNHPCISAGNRARCICIIITTALRAPLDELFRNESNHIDQTHDVYMFLRSTVHTSQYLIIYSK